MEKIIVYARVLTDRQTHDSQLEELRNYCSRRGWNNYEEAIDTASGAKTSREGLDRFMASVRHGKIDIVVV